MYSKLKRLANDTAIYGTFNIIGRFLSFLLTPFYTNLLKQSDFGNVVYVFSIVAFVNILSGMSLDTAFFRFYQKGDSEKEKQVFSTTFLLVLASSIATALLFFLASSYYSQSEPSLSEMFKYAAFLPLLDSIIMIPYCYLRAERKLIQFSITRVFVIALTVGLTIYLLKYTNIGVNSVFIANIIGSTIGIILLIPVILRNLNFTFDKSLASELLKFSVPIIPASLSVILLQFGDQFLLKTMVSSSDLALYSANYKLALPMMMFVTMFDYAWKPYYMSHLNEPDANVFFARVMTYFVFVCSFVFLVCVFLMKYIVAIKFFGGTFYNPIYWSSLELVVPFVLIGYFFNGVYNNLGLGLNLAKKTKYFSIAVGIAAIVNFGSNYLLIPLYGFKAAAWSTAWSYLVSAAVLYFYARKVYTINYEFGRIAKLIIATGAIYSVKVFAESYNQSIWLAIGLILIYPILLIAIGFFSKSEIAKIRLIVKI